MNPENLTCSSLCAVVESLEVGVIVLDEQQRITHWNRWLAKRSDMDNATVCGQKLSDVFAEIAGSRLDDALTHALKDGLPSLLSPALHGTLLPLYRNAQDKRLNLRMQQLVHVIPLGEGRGPAACLIQISDMSANISREKLLRQQAESLRRKTAEDALTGLPNRKRFDEALASLFRKAQKDRTALALMVVDIDHFSDYNAHYGRDLGDGCLVDIAKVCRDAIRPVGDLAARYGGEEFGLILPGVTETDACQLAEKIRLQVCASNIPNEASRIARHLTVSIGVAVMSPDGESDTHTLLSSADVALYQAKHEGRNRAIYFSLDDGHFKTCG
jgi:diguanylate cyclase (GGDEF)-like protein